MWSVLYKWGPFLKNEKQDGSKIHLLLFATTFFSSCCLYFDQKLIIIPAICFIKIVKSNKLLKLKLFSIFYYFLLSLPYLYLIILWGGLIPTVSIESRKLGSEIFLDHIGFTSTMIAFYLLPLLLFRNESAKDLIKNFFLNRRNYFLLSLFIIYLFYMIAFYDLNEQLTPGKGFVNKISLMFFNENLLKSIFIYVSFFISWIIILVYIENKLKDVMTIVYLFILSIFLWPIHQEYFDPLILLMAFTFFNSKMVLDYKNSAILFVYLFILLIS